MRNPVSFLPLLLTACLITVAPPATAQDTSSSSSSSSSDEPPGLWPLICVATYDYLAGLPDAQTEDWQKAAREHAAQAYVDATGYSRDDLETDKQALLASDGFVTTPGDMVRGAITCNDDFDY